MSSLIASSSHRVPVAHKSDQKMKTQETRVGKLAAKGVVDDLQNNNKIRIISLKDDNGEMFDGAECIAAEFATVQKGVINSMVSPMTLQLTKEEHRKRIKMTNLKKLKGIMNKMIKTDDRPFARFEKVQIMYVPLFNRNENDHGSMTISLVDAGKTKAGVNDIIQQVTFESDVMALIELSMNYFIAKKDIESISLEMSVDSIPIEGRAYGAIFAAFFVHEEHSPMRLEERQSTLMYIDNLAAPTDLNTTTVFKGLGDKITKDIEEKKVELRRKRMQNNLNLRKGMRQIELNQDSSSSDENLGLIEAGRKSVSAFEDIINKNREKRSIPATTYDNSMRKIDIMPKKFKTMLDTGSAEHFFYYENIFPKNVQKNIAGVDELIIEDADVNLILGDDTFHIGETKLFKNANLNFNILSFSKLKDDGIVDTMISSGDIVILELDSSVVMQFDNKSPGRMWLKDDVWKKDNNLMRIQEEEDDVIEETKGLGIKYTI